MRNKLTTHKNIKWGLIAGLVVCSGLAYRAYGYKLTVGNLFGMKVQSIRLKDSKTGKVFDLNGTFLRTDPITTKNNFNQGRTLEYKVAGARAARIYFFDQKGIRWCEEIQEGNNFGAGTVRFPIQDSQTSIAYRLEATPDDWQILESWDAKSPNQALKIIPGVWPQLQISNLRSENFDLPEPELLVRIFRSSEPKPQEISVLSLDKRNSFPLSKIGSITKIELLRREYRIVSKGFLAFGKKGDPSDQCDSKLPPIIQSIAEPEEKRVNLGIQWTVDGKAEDYARTMGISIDRGNTEPEKRLVQLRVLAATPDPKAVVAIVPENGVRNLGFSRTNDIYQKRNLWEFTCLVPHNLRKIDLKVTVATAEFDEVVRTQKPRQYGRRLGTEPAGTAVVEVSGKRDKNDRVFTTFWLKVPEKYRNDDLQLICLGENGKEQIPMSRMSLRTEYIGVQFYDLDPKEDVRELILKARPRTTYIIKDVQLYPKDIKR